MEWNTPRAEAALGKRSEEGLEGVKPRARCWGEVEHPAGMAGEPLDGLGRLARGIVIEHDTNHLSGRDLAFYGVKETDEPLMPVALHASAEHGAVENVGALEGADTCRPCFLQMRCTELSPMATALAIARPVQWVAFARRLRAVQRQQPLHGLTRQRRLAGNARLLAQQPVHAQLREAVLPAPDRRTANTGTPRQLLHRPDNRRNEG